MCGIVGIIGTSEVAPRIVGGLKRLEYRGYDSAGVATLTDKGLDRRRAVGKLAALVEHLENNPIAGHVGIGHTRWATHGAVNESNAHPHLAGRVMVVHNGIVENFREIREELSGLGRSFETDTDTEVVAVLCDSYLEAGLVPADAVKATLERLEGAYALCFLLEGTHDLMFCARKGSPLAIGYGEGEMYVGSDALALAPLTNKITYLEEGDWACLTRDQATIFDAEGRPANREVKTINLSTALVDKGDHRHYMAKEICEQTSVVAYTLGEYLDAGRNRIEMPQGLDFARTNRISIVACGTAYLAGVVAKYWFEQIARLPVEVDVASEFRYRSPPVNKDDVAVFVSQSGETADTLAAIRYCKQAGQTIASVVNVPESSIARESDVVLRSHAGPEISVASTKGFTCQLTVLAALVIYAARQRGQIDAAKEESLIAELAEVPRLISEALTMEKRLNGLAMELAKARDVLYLGRGPMYPLALEGALKLKEISYIHAEGYASGELKHGPIALIDEKVPVIVLAPSDALYDKTISNMQEVMARGGRVLLVSDREGLEHAGEVWRTVEMPVTSALTAPIIYAIPVQMLAYHTAVAKGTDVDQPRNLAKSVTVE